MASDRKLTEFFLLHAAKHKKRYLVAFALMPVSALLAVAGPNLVKKAIDDGVATGNVKLIGLLALIYLGVVVLNFFATICQMILVQTAGVKTLEDIRKALLKHISFLPKAIFERRPLGMFVNRLTSDVEAIGETIATGLANILTDFLTIIVIFGVILYHNLRLGLMTLFLIPIIVVLVYVIQKKLRWHHDKIRTVHGKVMSQLNEIFTMLYEVRNFNLTKQMQGEFAEKSDEYKRESMKAISYDALIYSVLEGLSFLTIGIVLFCIGKSWFVDMSITIGELIMYVQLLEVLFSPVKQMGQRFAQIQSAYAALGKINSTIDLNPYEDEGKTPIVEKNVSFQNVSFEYNENEPVIKKFNLELPFGKSVALVGPTGSGKTTIARLMTRQYDPQEGSIQFGKVTLPDISRDELKRMVAIVPQDPIIFNETVAFNIGLGRSGITQDEIEEVAKKVLAHDFIMQLPQGYETVLVDNGRNLSAGQRQLIALATVLASEAQILIFDEATANIDTQTERLIQKALDYVMTQKTTIIVAHRLSTIRHVDHILVLHHGEIHEEGTHESLLKEDGIYSKMYQIQSH